MAVGRLLYVATIARTHTSHLAPVAERLVSRGWEIDGVANGLSEVARALPYEAIFDVPWTRQLSRVDAALRSWRPIQRIVRDGRYDVVHVHTPFASWITRMANRRSVGRGQAMVYTAHGFHFHEHGSRVKNLIFRSAEKLAGRFTTILTVMNDEDLSAATRHRLVPAGHVLQTPGIGIDFARWERASGDEGSRSRVRRSLGIADGVPIVVFVAEMNPRKRHADLLRALAQPNLSDAHAVIVGDGPEQDALVRLTKKLRLEERVHFLGRRSDVPELLTAADVMAFPSIREGLPKSVLEAMAIGLPIIGTDARGVRELLENGAGVLVRPRDPESLAVGIASVLEDPAMAKRIRTEAKSRVAAYEISNVVDLVEEVYHLAMTIAAAPR